MSADRGRFRDADACEQDGQRRHACSHVLAANGTPADATDTQLLAALLRARMAQP